MKKQYQKIIIFSLIFCNMILAVMFYSVSKILHYSDLSQYTSKISPSKVNNTYLVTYASGDPLFTTNQKFLSYSAIKHNIKHILQYNESDIDQEFYNKHKKILDTKAGAGLWLWKPYIIKKTLNLIPENSYLIYADVTMLFLRDPIPMLELAKKHQLVVVAYNRPTNPNIIHSMEDTTASAVFQKTNCNTLKCKKSPHVLSGFMVFKNTPQVRKFVNKWLEYCTNYDLTGYTGMQHDEILFGITNAQEKIGQRVLRKYEWIKYVHSHHRKRYALKAKPSVLPRQLRNERRIRLSKFIYTHPIMIRLRHFLFKDEINFSYEKVS